MMAFFMRFYKKFNRSFLILVGISLILLLPLQVYASNKMMIKSADLMALEDDYVLNATIEVKFNEEIEQTLLKGFELHFILEFQLASPRKYWFDDEIVTITHPIILSYHPLSRQYLMTQSGGQKAFATLAEVSSEFANLRQIKIIKKSEVEKGEPYKALLLLRLDNKKLPKTIQDEEADPTALEMKSQLFEWVPTILK